MTATGWDLTAWLSGGLLVGVCVAAVAVARHEARQVRERRVARMLSGMRFRPDEGEADWLIEMQR